MTRTAQSFRTSGASNRGFTLIELMVAMVISLFLIGGVVLMYASTKAAYTDSDRMARLQENIRFASDYLVRDIRNAGFWDQLTLSVIEQVAIQEKVAQTVDADGDGSIDTLVIRYAGRGHCQQAFNTYRVVENRYFFNANSGELRCSGAAIVDTDGDGLLSDEYDPVADPLLTDGTGVALVAGLTGIDFEFGMADGSVQSGAYECEDPDDGTVAPSTRCISVRIGLEFEGLRDLDNPGSFENRFVELTATLRNSAISQIYATNPGT